MPSVRDLVLARAKSYEKLEPNRTVVPGVLSGVDFENTPEVNGRPGYVWVREFGSTGGFFQCFNASVQTRVGVPVLVSKSPKKPYRRVVLGVDWDTVSAMITQATYEGSSGFIESYIQNHARQHEWPENAPGADAVKVYPRAFTPLRATPSDLGGLHLYVEPGIYMKSGTHAIFPGGTLDLSQYTPTAGYYIRILVYIDTTTNLLSTEPSAEYLTSEALPFPTVDSEKVQIAYIVLYNSTATLDESTIEDARAFISAIPNDEFSWDAVNKRLAAVEGEFDVALTMHVVG